jgi:uncharacterized membrane protein YbhN (UPF0104 family)
MSARPLAAPLWRRYGLTALQALVSLALVFWLTRQIDWGGFWRTLAGADPLLMLLACANYYVGLLINSVKWRLALKIEGRDAPLGALLRWYLIGGFANNLLPTSVGGDVLRGYYANRRIGSLLATSRSILADRLTGLLGAVLLALVGVATLLGQPGPALLLALALPAGLGLLWALRANLHRLPAALQPLAGRLRDLLGLYARRPGALLALLALALLFQVSAGLGSWWILRSVGLDLPLVPVVLATAVVSVSGVLPISINGLGLNESLVIGLLAAFQQPRDRMLAGLVLGRVLLLLVSLAGALPLALERREEPPPAQEETRE